MGLQLALYDSPTGDMIADYSSTARDLRCSTNQHGFEALSCFVPMSVADAFRLYDRPGVAHVRLGWNGQTVWEGRLEDIALKNGGVDLGAFGYWRALSETPYLEMWSNTSYGEWRPITPDDNGAYDDARWKIDNQNRLFMAPSKGATFDNVTYYAGGLTYRIPDQSSRLIVACSFDYEFKAPTTWVGVLETLTASFGSVGVPVILYGNNALQTGSANLTFGGVERLAFDMFYPAAAAVYGGETGQAYFKVTNLRVKTTTSASLSADEIVRHVVSCVTSVNPGGINASTALIQSPGLDLHNEQYLDLLPSAILERLASLGDTQTPPRQWEVGVYEDRLLHFRPRGSAGRTWYVDAATLEVQRSLDQLYNSTYAAYEDAGGETKRLFPSYDQTSITRFGLTRQRLVTTQTTASVEAQVHQDAVLTDTKNPPPRASLSFREVYDEVGARWPLWMVRSGDSVVIRNLPATLSTDIDRIRRFRITRTEYHVDQRTITVEPESPLPTLDALLARRQA